MLRFLPVLVAPVLFCAGCGYVGDPLPPRANIPAAVTDLAAIQRSARIIVQFTLPTLTTEGVAIREPLQVDLRVGSGDVRPFSADAWAENAKPIQPVAVEKDHARLDIPTKDWTGQEVTIGVRTIGANGKESAWSNFVNLSVVPPPAVPASLAATATAEGVLLTWQGAPGQFRIFRRAGKETEFTRMADVDQTRWVDSNSQFGVFYSYSVQRIVKTGEGREAQSELSAAATINPADTFAPAPPTGLRAVPAPGSIELSWDRNPESDLAGYKVYRAAAGGNWESIAAPPLPGFGDRNVEKGKTYRYAVTAIDKSGNESGRSGEVTAGLP